MEFIDISIILQSTKKYILLSATHEILWKIVHILDHEENLKRLPSKRAVIISPSLSDHYKRKLEANSQRNCRILAFKWKLERYAHEWPRIIKEIVEEVKRFWEENENKNMTYQSFWRRCKVIIEESLLARGTYIKGRGKISSK